MTFPVAPANNQLWTEAGRQYIFDAVLPGWRLTGGAGAARDYNGFGLYELADPRPGVTGLQDATSRNYVDTQILAAPFVELAGDTMTGPLVLPPGNPTLPNMASNKQYVDIQDALDVKLAGSTMTGPLILSGDPTLPLGSVTKQYADAQNGLDVKKAGDTMSGLLLLSANPTAPLGAVTKQYADAADALRVLKSGDTMTGPLVIPGPPTLGGQAANKTYVDAADALNVKKAGDTMTGLLVLSADPTGPLGAVTKQYADAADALRVLKSGDTMTGPLVIPGPPTLGGQATNKTYVDTQNALDVKLAGSTMTGPLLLSGDPTVPLGAVTKQYADAADALRVLKSGDTMTGPLVLPGNPVNPLEAADKAYVDQSIASGNLYQGQWRVAPNLPDLTPAVANPLNGYSWIAQTADPNVAEIAPAALPGIGGQTIYNGDTIKWNAALLQYDHYQGSSLTIAQADARYVNQDGDTMTGALVLNADPGLPLQAATKQYTDNLIAAANTAINGKVAKIGDTMTGALILPIAAPTAPAEAANKQYVDTAVTGGLAGKVAKVGDTMTGPLVLPIAPPTLGTQATNKDYVDQQIANNALYQGTWQVAANTPNLITAAATNLNGYSWIAQTANPNTPEIAPAGIPGIAGQTIEAGSTVKWNDATNLYEIIRGPNLSLASATGLFVNVTGDTMTGALNLGDGVVNIPYPPLAFRGPAGSLRGFGGYTGATGARWTMYLGDNAAESGGDTGSNFLIQRWNDANNFFDVLKLDRVAGYATFSGDLEARFLKARGGAGTGVAATAQLRMGYNNQAGATYGHEIRTTHDGNTVARNVMEFWLWQQGDVAAGAPSNHVLDLAGDRINAYQGLNFGSTTDANAGTSEKHLTLWGDPTSAGNNFSIGVTGGRMNFNGPGTNQFTYRLGNADKVTISDQRVMINTGAGGYYIGDAYHGLFFDGGTTAMWIEYHADWRFRMRTGPVDKDIAVIDNANGGGSITLKKDTNSGGAWAVMTARDFSNRGVFEFRGNISGNIVGGNPEGTQFLYQWNGGYGYSEVYHTVVNSPGSLYFQGNVSVQSLTNRSSAKIKQAIAYVDPAIAARPFDHLKVVTYHNADRPWPVDEHGEKLAEKLPDPEEWKRQRLGFIAEDLRADPDLGRFVFGEGEETGYDPVQLVALCVAKIQSLENRIKELEQHA